MMNDISSNKQKRKRIRTPNSLPSYRNNEQYRAASHRLSLVSRRQDRNYMTPPTTRRPFAPSPTRINAPMVSKASTIRRKPAFSIQSSDHLQRRRDYHGSPSCSSDVQVTQDAPIFNAEGIMQCTNMIPDGPVRQNVTFDSGACSSSVQVTLDPPIFNASTALNQDTEGIMQCTNVIPDQPVRRNVTFTAATYSPQNKYYKYSTSNMADTLYPQYENTRRRIEFDTPRGTMSSRYQLKEEISNDEWIARLNEYGLNDLVTRVNEDPEGLVLTEEERNVIEEITRQNIGRFLDEGEQATGPYVDMFTLSSSYLDDRPGNTNCNTLLLQKTAFFVKKLSDSLESLGRDTYNKAIRGIHAPSMVMSILLAYIDHLLRLMRSGDNQYLMSLLRRSNMARDLYVLWLRKLSNLRLDAETYSQQKHYNLKEDTYEFRFEGCPETSSLLQEERHFPTTQYHSYDPRFERVKIYLQYYRDIVSLFHNHFVKRTIDLNELVRQLIVMRRNVNKLVEQYRQQDIL